jgi:diguanylate cyclase (GGDEF)-like protein
MAEVRKTPPPELADRLILVVDDDEHTRNLLRDLCESIGYRVALAEDGAVALTMVEKEKPHLVLLDLMMPQRDGFSVLKVLREDARHQDLPVILLTAMGDMDGKLKGMELGADDYITKPFKLVELQTRISSALMVHDFRRRLMAAEEELAHLRALDPITGAGTYSALKASLDSELARSRRYGRPAAALLFGFDDYQGLRYQLGREACDGFLARVVQEMRTALRGADHVFRIDADEFVVVLPETDLKGARITAERLATMVQRINVEGNSGPVDVVARVGGAVFPGETVRTTEDLLREANRSLRALQERKASRVFEP